MHVLLGCEHERLGVAQLAQTTCGLHHFVLGHACLRTTKCALIIMIKLNIKQDKEAKREWWWW